MINQVYMARQHTQETKDFVEEVTTTCNELERSGSYKDITLKYNDNFTIAVLVCTFKDIHCYNDYLRYSKDNDKLDSTPLIDESLSEYKRRMYLNE